MFKFLSGVAVGIILSFLYLAIDQDGGKTARAAGKVAVEKIAQTKSDICRRKFLDETHCYQDQQKTSEQCDKEIQKRCQ